MVNIHELYTNPAAFEDLLNLGVSDKEESVVQDDPVLQHIQDQTPSKRGPTTGTGGRPPKQLLFPG